MGIVIRQEAARDYSKVENLVREAFWNVYRPGCYEHLIVHKGRLNPAFVPELDLVMELDGDLIGHIIYFRSRIELDGGGSLPCLIFGPMSIAPKLQRRGYGKRLLDYSLNLSRSNGNTCVCIEGDIGFYGKSGFVVAGGQGIREQGEEPGTVTPHFLLHELVRGTLYGKSGQFIIPDVYFVSGEEVEEFDGRFPPKKKLRLPGQLE